MSNIKPIQINPELFKISNNSQKNKTLKKKPPTGLKPNVLKKDLLARIKSHRANKIQKNSESDETKNDTPSDNNLLDTTVEKENTQIPISVEPNTNKISKINNNNLNSDDDFLQSIDFLKSLSKRKQNKINKNNNFPLEKNSEIGLEKDNSPVYGCLKNGSLPTFRELHNKTIKKDAEESKLILNSNNTSNNKKNVSFKYNLGKKH